MLRLTPKYLANPGLADRQNRLVVRCGFAIALVAVVVRVVFWVYTGRAWEDALITLAHAQNAATGLGLTLEQGGGRPIQGFSSPLGLLVPLVSDMFLPGSGLTALRLVSAFAAGLTVLYVMGLAIFPAIRLSPAAAILAMGYVAIEHHQISWGMSGMETQMATLALAASLYYLVSNQPLAFGLSLGLCVLARPEFALWAVAGGIVLCVRNRRDFLVSALSGLGLYLPWLVFATLYYGSPVPNTIIAKGLGYPLWWKTGADGLVKPLAARLSGQYLPDSIFQPLGPSFAGHGTHFSRILPDHGAICLVVVGLALAGCVAALFRRRGAMAPFVLFAGLYGAYLVFAVAHVFAWYVAPFSAVIIFLAAYGVDVLAPQRFRNILSVGFVVAYMALMCAMLPVTFNAEKRIQSDIEDMVRKPACQYLASVMKPGETLGGESLGYTAYYTGRQIYDWPGLASGRVVEYSRQHPEGRSLPRMLETLQPDYLLLRPFEIQQARQQGRWLDQSYQPLMEFKALPCSDDILLISRNIDREFTIFKKK